MRMCVCVYDHVSAVGNGSILDQVPSLWPPVLGSVPDLSPPPLHWLSAAKYTLHLSHKHTHTHTPTQNDHGVTMHHVQI